MLALNDPRWKELTGGYKIPYDASIALGQLENGEDVWEELWTELHHQGDVGEASYAAVPHIARIAKSRCRNSWQPYALVCTIEIERHRASNPPIPDWLLNSYEQGIQELFLLVLVELEGTSDPLFVRVALGLIALAKQLTKYGALVSYFDESDIDQLLEEHLLWSQLYKIRTPTVSST